MGTGKYYAGVIEIEERGITKGYISAFVSFDIKSIGALNFPDFVESNLSILNRVIDVKNLKYFSFMVLSYQKFTEIYIHHVIR